MELTPKLDLGEFHQNVFTSMATFCGLLNRTFVQAAGAVSKAQIKRIIEQMTFNETVRCEGALLISDTYSHDICRSGSTSRAAALSSRLGRSWDTRKTSLCTSSAGRWTRRGKQAMMPTCIHASNVLTAPFTTTQGPPHG